MKNKKKPVYVTGNDLPWRHIFVSVFKIFFFQLIVGTLVSALFAQLPGFIGYLSGAILVLISFGSGVLVASVAGRRSMTNAAKSLIVAYFVKILLLGLIVFLVPLPPEYRNGWLLAGAIVSVCVWLTVEMRTMLNLRILYFDLPR